MPPSIPPVLLAATLGFLGTATAFATDPPQAAASAIGASIPTSPTAPRSGEAVAVPLRDEPGHAAVSPALNDRTSRKPHVTQAKVSAPPVTNPPANLPTSGPPAAQVGSKKAEHEKGAPPDLLASATLDDAQLAKERGGAETPTPTDLHVNQNNSSGTVAGNVASQLTTGSNNIGDGAFSNSAGIPIVIQNSGNNVLIQNSTILNLQLAAPK